MTEFVRAMEPGTTRPDAEHCSAVWEILRETLIRELKRRCLWNAPPSYLGVFGATSWSDDDALEELLAECWAFIFIHRLRGLEAQLRKKANIDGLVHLNVRNFLYDAQKKYDPLGFRIFDVLNTAIRQLIDAGVLRVLEGDPRVRNETVLGFTSWSDAAAAAGAELSEEVRTWNDDLLPELVTARGSDLEPVLARLRGHVAALGERDVEAFRFKDVIDPLKNDARLRWSAVWQHTGGETALEESAGELKMSVRLVDPDLGFEERQFFQKLLACVGESLDRLRESGTTKTYLSRLWVLQRSYAAEPDGQEPPSGRKMAEMLDIPRYRLPGLHDTLGRLVEGCREALSKPPLAGGEEESL